MTVVEVTLAVSSNIICVTRDTSLCCVGKNFKKFRQLDSILSFFSDVWPSELGCVKPKLYLLLDLHICINFYTSFGIYSKHYPEQMLISLQRNPQQMNLLPRISCWWQQMSRYFALKLLWGCYPLYTLNSPAYSWCVSCIMWWITPAGEMMSFSSPDTLTSFSFISITGLCFCCFDDLTRVIDSNPAYDCQVEVWITAWHFVFVSMDVNNTTQLSLHKTLVFKGLACLHLSIITLSGFKIKSTAQATLVWLCFFNFLWQNCSYSTGEHHQHQEQDRDLLFRAQPWFLESAWFHLCVTCTDTQIHSLR